MGLFQEILDEIVGTAQGNIRDKIKQMIDQRNLIKTLNNMENKLDTYLIDNYGNETYYDSLYKYIHSGKVNQDTYSNEKTSAFYYTLICAFLNSDDKYLGENNFCKQHLEKIRERYKNVIFDQNNIIKCFAYYYNSFKNVFDFISDDNRSMVNAIKETVIDNNDNIMTKIADESNSIKITIDEGIEKILQQGNAKDVFIPEREDKICDNNNEYQERFKDTLFLESDINDDKKASLDKIYIEPHIEFTFTSIKEWVEDRDSRILLLYGKAGIGKTSFTSWLSLKNDFDRECHILELRNFISALDSNNPWESIKKCFKCMNDEKYQNKVLILDGLDEVCVLKSDFDGHEFIHNLNNSLKTGFGRSIRVIITSRMGYFTDIHRSNYIDVAKIFWMEDSVEKWCEAYSNIHTNRTEWCEAFKKAYADLGEDDKRKDAFCTPIILYICCVSQIDISKHDSVASIYDEAFNVIGKRQYNELTLISKKEFEVNRQFTKELAFQMFLNDMLEDILSGDFVRIAKEKVVYWTQSKLSYNVNEPDFEKLFAINHFAYGKNNAIEFAHKTIGEYFTAVKLYEDYFDQINGASEKIWQNIFNAFRYKAIPEDIMQYLVDIISSRQDDSWKEELFRAYYIGIEKQLLFACDFLKPEYSPSQTTIIKQIQMAFRNLTWLLTGLGFDNSQFANTTHESQILTSFFDGDVNVSGWKNLKDINAERTDLKYANFSLTILNGCNFNNASLKSAKLRKANLTRANLTGANLTEADFTGADLTGANLTEAVLTVANLTEAVLTVADFIKANLIKANLTKANLTKANLTGANLIKAVLTEAVLADAILTEAVLTEAVLQKANLTRAHLKGAHLERAQLEGANLIEANLTGANLTGANLIKAVLTEADLTRADLTRADLKGAHLERAQLEGANLTGANLIKAVLTEADLTKAVLTEADLTRADLTRADLTRADLTEAVLIRAGLTEADLTEANLKSACLIRADLTEADLKGAYLKNAHLEGAYLKGAHLEKADLTMTFLEGAHFKEAHLEGARLTKEDYNEAKRQGAYLDSESPENTQ